MEGYMNVQAHISSNSKELDTVTLEVGVGSVNVRLSESGPGNIYIDICPSRA